MKILNATPHAINMLDDDNNIIKTFETSDITIRIASKEAINGSIVCDEVLIPLSTTQFGEVTGLPEPNKDTFYIVSNMIKSALPNRTDLVTPGFQVRNEKGQVIGCKALNV